MLSGSVLGFRLVACDFRKREGALDFVQPLWARTFSESRRSPGQIISLGLFYVESASSAISVSQYLLPTKCTYYIFEVGETV